MWKLKPGAPCIVFTITHRRYDIKLTLFETSIHHCVKSLLPFLIDAV